MEFLQENRFKLKGTFSVAAMCGLTAYSILSSDASGPVSFLAILAVAHAWQKKALKYSANNYFKFSTPVPEDHPMVPVVKRLSEKAGLPMPKIRITKYTAPGTCAFIDNNLCLERHNFSEHSDFTEIEMESIAAHEIGHLKNNDPRSCLAVERLVNLGMVNTAFQVGAAFLAAEGSASAAIRSTLVSIGLMFLAVQYKQQVEYIADKMSANLLQSGQPLANSLEKLYRFDDTPLWAQRLFLIHPPVHKRIESLNKETGIMAAKAALPKSGPV